jgi:hypothetical protein
VWHVDQYDKLRHYGFCIHGAIDGFSRRVMWLEVFSTNRDPWIVARYYFKAISMVKGKLSKRAVHARMNNCISVITIWEHIEKQKHLYSNRCLGIMLQTVQYLRQYLRHRANRNTNTNLNGRLKSQEIEHIFYFNFSCTRKSKTWSWDWEYSCSRMSSFFKTKP